MPSFVKPPSPLATGQFKDVVGRELLYIGGSRLMDRDAQRGAYRIWEYVRPRIGGHRFELVHEGGLWRESVGWRVLWLGGDGFLVAAPGTGEYSLWEHDRDERLNLPFTHTRGRDGQHAFVGRNPVYAGRAHVVDMDDTTGGYRIFGAHPSPHWHIEARPPAPMPGPVPGMKLAWVGGDRLVAFDPGRSDGVMLRYGPNGIHKVRVRRFNGFKAEYWPRIDLSGRQVVYLGANRMLVWNPSTGDYRVYAVPFDTKIHPEIEDYLELHLDARESIGLPVAGGESQPYRVHDSRGIFYRKLEKYYRALRAGDPVELTYESTVNPDTGDVWTGPRNDYYQAAPELIIGADVVEIYAAHVAQSLWIEIARKVPWRLHDLEREHLELLLHCDHLFSYVDTTPDGTMHYHVASEFMSSGMPTNPTFYYRFLTGDTPDSPDDLLAPTRRETVFSLCRWMTRHLRHGPLALTIGDAAEAEYGFRGYPPIECMISKRTRPPPNDAIGPRFYSFMGAHSAAAIVSEVLRSVNIPARARQTFLEQTADTGFDVPGEGLFTMHSDQFYAIPPLLDPELDPASVFVPEADYESARDHWIEPPPAGQGAERLKAYWTHVYSAAIPAATWWSVREHWQNRLDDPLVNDAGYTQAEADQMVAAHESALLAARNAWLADHGPAGAAEYEAFWDQWLAER